MEKLAVEQVMSLDPCPDYPRDVVERLFDGVDSIDALDVLDMCEHGDLPAEDALWVVTYGRMPADDAVMVWNDTLRDYPCTNTGVNDE